jgi:hypothetical protein
VAVVIGAQLVVAAHLVAAVIGAQLVVAAHLVAAHGLAARGAGGDHRAHEGAVAQLVAAHRLVAAQLVAVVVAHEGAVSTGRRWWAGARAGGGDRGARARGRHRLAARGARGGGGLLPWFCCVAPRRGVVAPRQG